MEWGVRKENGAAKKNWCSNATLLPTPCVRHCSEYRNYLINSMGNLKLLFVHKGTPMGSEGYKIYFYTLFALLLVKYVTYIMNL